MAGRRIISGFLRVEVFHVAAIVMVAAQPLPPLQNSPRHSLPKYAILQEAEEARRFDKVVRTAAISASDQRRANTAPSASASSGLLWRVPQQFPSIQSAIDAAGQGDTVLVSEGTYFENIRFNGKAIIVASTYLTTYNGSVIERTIIDGSRPRHPDSGSVVYFVNGEDTNSVLYGFTIRGGTGTRFLSPGNDLRRSGGGVFCLSSGAKLVQNIVTSNSISFSHAIGGGLTVDNFDSVFTFVVLDSNQFIGNRVQGTTLTGLAGGAHFYCTNARVVGNVFEQNEARGPATRGGGIYFRGDTDSLGPQPSALISGNIFKSNMADATEGGGTSRAGALYLVHTGEVVVSNNLFKDNVARSATGDVAGGGVAITDVGDGWYGRKLVRRNEFVANRVETNRGGFEDGPCSGGAVWLSNSSATISNNMFSANSAASPQDGSGAGCMLSNSVFLLDGNTFRNNNAANGGGGILVDNPSGFAGEHSLVNNIIMGNTARYGAGMAMYDLGAGVVSAWNNTIVGNQASVQGGGIITWGAVDLFLVNCILWENVDPTGYNQIANSVRSQYCDIQGNKGSLNIDVDPKFLIDGYPISYRLQNTSECIGSGIDSTLFNGQWYRAPSIDIYGNMRPNPAGSRPDIGACENSQAYPPGREPVPPLPAGTYTVGYGGSFVTLDSAFDRLSKGGITGSVILLLTDSLYVASPQRNRTFSLLGPITGVGPSNRITIRPADGVSVTVRGSGEAALLFRSVSHLTIDGISLEGPTRLRVEGHYDPAGTRFNQAVTFVGDCDFNTVQNLTAWADDNRWSAGVGFYADNAGAADHCIVSGVHVLSAVRGIHIHTQDYASFPVEVWTSFYSSGMVIRGNRVGSPEGSIMTRGIVAVFLDSGIVENNEVAFLTGASGGGQYGLAVIGTHYTIVRGNVVHDLNAPPGAIVTGILCNSIVNSNFVFSGRYLGIGLQIYNNMIYDIGCQDTVSSLRVAGISCAGNLDPLIAYNTILLDGENPGPGGRTALLFQQGNQRVTIRNNILVNLCTGNPGGPNAVNTAMRFDNGLDGVAVCDNNDLYVESIESGYLARTQSLAFKSLASWQLFGFDGHSVNVNPVHAPPHLHIDTTATVNALLAHAGVSILGIEFDFDGDLRGEAPDIGADQFSPASISTAEESETVPRSLELGQNYPNPFNASTKLQILNPKFQILRLAVFDLLGREVAVLVNEEKPAGVYTVTWDARLRSANFGGPAQAFRALEGGQASGMASGVYFCQLKAGDRTLTRKMILIR